MPRWRALLLTVAMLVSSAVAVLAVASPAQADPACQSGGYYVIYARGMNATLFSREQKAFLSHIHYLLPGAAFAELGNIDGDVNEGKNNNQPDDSNEYPASHVLDYSNSVTKGVNELVTHLNDRYSRPACASETLILAGYSEGAEVVGAAMNRVDLSAMAKARIGYVALYGDPKFQGYDQQPIPWWVQGTSRSYHLSGTFGARQPYVPDWLTGRLGSWCDNGDKVCTGDPAALVGAIGNHGDIYRDYWFQQSAHTIVAMAKIKRYQLSPVSLYSLFTAQDIAIIQSEMSQFDTLPFAVPAELLPKPTIQQLKRTTDHVGIRQVYASTKCAITEGWWDSTGVHTSEVIHISQCDITGFDKVNEPDGATQSLYTAVPDGVWETWWRPNEGIHHNKIITGLSGVRQVIADNRQESAGYTHRLYVLASDGPHEYWWRDGGDGIHHKLLDNIAGAVTMDKSTGPGGEDQLYVAVPTWVYELWWGTDGNVRHSPIINITQGDIRSIDKTENQPDGGQALLTGTSTTAWQSYWNSSNGTPISHGTLATGQVNAIQIKRSVYNGVYQLYLATNDHVQEYWWSSTSSGTSTLIDIVQGDVTSFDKSNDGNFQQVYTGTGNGDVWETYWAAGVGVTSKVLFSVER